MKFRLPALLLLSALSSPAASANNPPFLLPPGEFRVLDLHVPQTPLRVDAAFRVMENQAVSGSAAVRMELLPRAALRAMQQGLAHQALAVTADGSSGKFTSTIEDPGAYRIVITNRDKVTPAMIALSLSTDLNAAVAATELSPTRRITVIAVSFLIFFAMVGYSGWKLRKSALG